MIVLYVIGGAFLLLIVLAICTAPSRERLRVKVSTDFQEKDRRLRSRCAWDELIYIGQDRYQLQLPKRVFGISAKSGMLVYGSFGSPKVVSADNIISYQPVMDGSTAITGGGSALAFHGIAVGSSRAKAHRFVKSIGLKLVVSDPSEPIVEVEIFSAAGRGLSPNSSSVRTAVRRLEHLQALLQIAMRTAKNRSLPAIPAG